MAWSWRVKRLVQAAWDAVSWLLAVPLAVLLRYDMDPPARVIETGLIAGALCASAYLALGALFHLYRGRYIVGSFDEVLGVVATTATVAILSSAIALILPSTAFPRTTIALAAGLSAASMLGARFVWRGVQRKNALDRVGHRTLIYGAGDAGSQIVELLARDKGSAYQPVGFIDDDPAKRHLRRSGIRVLGSIDSLEDIVRGEGVDTVLVAIAGISARRLLELDRRCATLDVQLRIIPTASEIAGGAVKLGDISNVTEEDLMGRRPIETNESQIEAFLEGRTILVTGAGGSIGSELARQLHRYSPQKVYLLDRDESALHAVQLTIDGTGTLTSDTLILADIRDSERLREIFLDIRPDIVFHAAALKHLPLLERFPNEAVKTNVIGSLNVLRAAIATGVSAFVNISTDKAADPESTLGYSKLITERLAAAAPTTSGAKFVSVRFGNVLGSRGSVIDTFRHQIAAGGPVTVTDPQVTRYFMTVSEAVHLVLQAAVIGRHGETLVLDMGTPVNIADIAKHMVERSGRQVQVIFTGLRPGEKLHEDLMASRENASRPFHPLISHVQARPLPHEEVSSAVGVGTGSGLLKALAHLESSTPASKTTGIA